MIPRVEYARESVIPENLPDVKPSVLQSYGVREAGARDALHIRVVLGSSTTDAADEAGSWRIQSEQDPQYAYENFVCPESVEVVERTETEFVVPPNFVAPSQCQTLFGKRVVDLALPEPMSPGCTYSVVGIGRMSDGKMVTSGKTAASFRYDPEGPAFEETAESHEQAASVIGLRAIRYLGDGVLEAEFGAGFNEGAARQEERYQVRVNQCVRKVVSCGWRSVLDVYHPDANGPSNFKVYRMHRVFLKLETPLQEGDVVSLTVSPRITCGANVARLTLSDRSSLAPCIKINQVGYLPGEEKIAKLGYWMGSHPENEFRWVPTMIRFSGEFTVPVREPLTEAVAEYRAQQSECALCLDAPPAFEIRDAVTHAAVWTGEGTFRYMAQQWDAPRYVARFSGENVFDLDFTNFQTPGRYYLAIPGIGRSFDFTIEEEVYRAPFEVASYGVFAQRCGQELAPPYSEWRRIACHTNGIMVSTCDRHLSGEWGDFKNNTVLTTEYDDLGELAEALDIQHAVHAARNRESLFAYFPFDGNGENAIEGGFSLVPVGTPRFVVEGTVVDRETAMVYATDDVLDDAHEKNVFEGMNTNGWTATFAADPTRGLTINYWMRRQDVEGNNYSGDHVRIKTKSNAADWNWEANVGILSNWGLLRNIPNGQSSWARVGDNEWRNYTVVIPPVSEEAPTRSVHPRTYVNGEPTFEDANNSFIWPEDCSQFTLRFACITSERAFGCQFDELRFYNEELPVETIEVLAQVGDGETTIPHPKKLRVVGGHHDAGDYNPRSHMDVAYTLLNVYELYPQNFYDGQLNIPEQNNGIPDIVDEALWAIQLWHGLYNDETGAVFNGTESQGDPNFIQTVELDNKGDYTWAPDSQGAFTYAAACAWVARLLADFPEAEYPFTPAELTARARKAYAWGVAHPPTDLELGSNAYNTYHRDPMAHAAVELLHATGEAAYAADVEAILPWTTDRNTEIIVHAKHNLASAAYAYLSLPANLANATLRSDIYKAVKKEGDSYVSEGHAGHMNYPHILHAWAPITWASGAHPNYLMPVLNLSVRSPDAAERANYRRWMVRSADHCLGRHPLGLCWTVGIGPRTVRAPLHNSRYSASGLPVTGMQAQGPHKDASGYNYAATCYPKGDSSFAPLQTFADAFWAIAMDEGTINNQAFTMALFGALLPPHVPTEGLAPAE